MSDNLNLLIEPVGRRVRVLFPFVGDSVGGAQVSGSALIENLDRSIFDPLVVVHEEGPLTAFLESKNIEFQLVPLKAYLGRKRGLLNQLFALLVTAPKLVRYLIGNEIEIVHAQDGRMNLTWVLPSRLLAVPFIWHQRSKFAHSRLLSLGAAFATHIISISEYTFSTLPRKLRTKASTIENPVENVDLLLDRARSRVDLCSALNLNPEDPVVGFFGNLKKQKRPDIFIKMAAEYLDNAESTPTFVLFGADRDNLQSEFIDLSQRLEWEDRFVFGGFVMNPERWMAGCDVVVSPGVDEAFGRTLVEAMLVGTPVIAADSGGHKQIIKNGKTGILVPPDDVTAFAKAIGDLLRDDSRAKSMARMAAADMAPRFSIQKHVDEVSKTYVQALGLSPNHGS